MELCESNRVVAKNGIPCQVVLPWETHQRPVGLREVSNSPERQTFVSFPFSNYHHRLVVVSCVLTRMYIYRPNLSTEDLLKYDTTSGEPYENKYISSSDIRNWSDEINMVKLQSY